MTTRGGRIPSQRQLRVGEAIRHALADVLGRRDLHDPTLNDTPVTVTEVRMTPDLRTAAVFVAPLGGRDAEAVMAALDRSQPYLRHHVAQAVRLKFAPTLRFQQDTSFDVAQRIDALLHDPRVEADLKDAADDPDGGTADGGDSA